MSSPNSPSLADIAIDMNALGDKLSGNTQRLVFHVDIFLMVIGLCFVLLSLPRVLARFSRGAEWTQGYFIRSVRISGRRRRRPSVRRVGMHDVSHGKQPEAWTQDSQPYVVRRPSKKAGEKGNTPSYPPHIPEWPVIARPLGWLLRCRVAPSYSLGQFLLILGYSAVIAYGWFYDSNPFADPNRTGFVAVSQIPVVFVFATKNNLVGLFIGAGYEKVCILSVREFPAQEIK